MAKKRISLNDLMHLMSLGPIEVNVSRCLEEAGTGKIHVGLEVRVAVVQSCDHIELKLVKENPDEELDVEEVDHGGGVLRHLPSSSHLPGAGDSDPH